MSKNCILCESPIAESLCELPSPVGPRRYWHCGCCDMVFLDENQRFDLEGEKHQYELHQNSFEDQGYCEFFSRLKDPLVDILSKKDFVNGLDFGSGPQPVFAELMKHAGYPMDIYDPIFSDSKSVLSKTYDFVTSTEVVEHFYDPKSGFETLAKLMHEDSILGLMTGMLDSWDKFANWHYRRELTHVCFYSRKTMEWLANRFSWEIIYFEKNSVIFKGH